MAREVVMNLIHHLKFNTYNAIYGTNDLSQTYHEIELGFSDMDNMYHQQLYSWVLMRYSSYSPLLRRISNRPDVEIVRNQAMEALILLETRIDELALMMAFEVRIDSLKYQEAIFWLNEAQEYARLIARKIIYIKELEKNVLRIEGCIVDGTAERAANNYLLCLYENEKKIQDHMELYFGTSDGCESKDDG